MSAEDDVIELEGRIDDMEDELAAAETELSEVEDELDTLNSTKFFIEHEIELKEQALRDARAELVEAQDRLAAEEE